MGATRPDAIIQRMDDASVGLDGAIRELARMLAIVDYEHDENVRVFGFSRSPEPHYVQLREAARQAVAEAGGRTEPNNTDGTQPPSTTGIRFKSLNGETTVIFTNRRTAGRILCFSARDGYFDAPAAEIDRCPDTEPTRQLFTELADNFRPA